MCIRDRDEDGIRSDMDNYVKDHVLIPSFRSTIRNIPSPAKRDSQKKDSRRKQSTNTVFISKQLDVAPTFKNLNANSIEQEEVKCECTDVLLVDDNDFNLAGLKMQVQRQNYKCELAYNGQDAIDKLVNKNTVGKCSNQCHGFRLVLMDVNMPVMDGLEATRQIKLMIDQGKLEYIPVVACSAYVNQSDIESCFSAGMEDFLSKPVLPAKLKAVLEKWCPQNFQMFQ
eukprot:TRINITY_DN8539_c0_g1_i2.p1 TRINITY_DN8539_c0_g1~~TRINITY_DN8539_c0_g1_i2.p1  ORF type:complete len:227 (+),score=8.14 TRINITY_DN8539_c0_g1_i2:100-780(+)